MNTCIYIAPVKQKSSEALVMCKQMTLTVYSNYSMA